MAKLYDRSTHKLAAAPDTGALLTAIQSFLNDCRKPAVLEAGENPIVLLAGQYVLEIRAGKLGIEVWSEERSFSRRILSVDHASTGILDCTIQRFGGKSGTLTFLDLARPQTAPRSVRATRQNFSEQFRRMLSRQFPGWGISALSSALDLRRSFSATFPRAWLTRGANQIAALACPAPEDEPALLSSALLWHNHVRVRAAPHPVSLCLFLPETAGNLSAHRLRWLTGFPLRPQVFRFNSHGAAGEVDPRDLGNLETRLSSQYTPVQVSPELRDLLSRLEKIAGVGCCPELGGAVSIRVRGLEFARIEQRRVLLGIETKEEVNAGRLQSVLDFALHLSDLAGSPRSASSHGSVPAFPERWFESVIRSNLTALDPDLQLNPVHGQVLTFAAGDRELIDLLAISCSGRLAVIELKASEDIHLPLQGLDYWMRVGWHAGRQELRSLFPAVSISNQLPKLLLVAPALSFHPSNEIVLRYFSPEIEVERVGVNSEWYKTLKVVFRLRGSELPISHRSST